MAKSSNGHKTTTETFEPRSNSGSMIDVYENPQFEDLLLTAGKTIPDALVKSSLLDRNDLNKACRYISWMIRNLPPGDIRLQLALNKINGTVGIKGRARNDALQGHGRMYFPPNASKEELKALTEMQARSQRNDRPAGDDDGRDHR